MKKKINIGLYIGSWPQNIGNAFFDLGAKALLQAAIPEATFYPMGGAVHWMFNASLKSHQWKAGSRLGKFLGDKKNPISSNSLEIGQFAEVDLIVFAGMSMCREFVENNGKTFVEASKRGVAVLGLGAGGALYDSDESKVFSDFLNSLNKYSIITRDDDTFDLFNGKTKNIWSGIDCAFFLPDYFTPPKLALKDYDVENFDSIEKHPSIDHAGRKIIYTHHDLWGPLPKRYLAKPDTLVSDVPEDYLTLYSQVTETYADRVHACVATLAYGNKARLYSSTPRKALFSKVGVPEITEKICKLDMGKLKDLKAKQIIQTRKFVEELVG
ncbi:MAG: polysaccharide pyruvyl transferase family protein [Deltaproteobacteria bacterium]